ncbi:hypothetical protein V8E36_004275 [Tilletia maclaganii]
MSHYNNPYGAPPPGGYAPPQGGYQGYPPPGGPGGYPPPGQPPYGGGAPYQQQQQHYPPPGPPQQPYQQPPYGGGGGGYGGQTFYLGVPVAPLASHSVPQPAPGFDANRAVEAVRKATKGFGTDEALLIQVLTPLDAWQADTLQHAFKAQTGKDLISVIEKETSGYFENVLRAKALGAVQYDAWLIHRATDGVGTNEAILNEVLLGRSPQDMWLLRQAYQQRYGKPLERVVADDLSFKTKRLFVMAMQPGARPDDSLPVDSRLVDSDVETLRRASRGAGTDEIAIAGVLLNRNGPHLAALARQYEAKHRTKLSKMIKSEFSGHFEDALLYVVLGAEGGGAGIERDAKLIEDAMAGMGTKDELLIVRIVRASWNRQRFEHIKQAYAHKHSKKGLKNRVEGETSGDYKRALSAIVGQ